MARRTESVSFFTTSVFFYFELNLDVFLNISVVFSIDHSQEAKRAMFDVASFFVSETLKSKHSFPSESLLQASLIENAVAINVGYLVPRHLYL
jgi:hypothetical protein